jgi:predicted amidophosphoribosyltransferase
MASLVARAWSVLVPPFCWECGGDSLVGAPLCAVCRRSLRWLGPEAVSVEGVQVWAPVAYEGPGRALVRGLKYRGAVGLAEPMAAAICAGAPSLGGPLVPVPLHPRRRRQRGFNQAERIAAALGRRAGLPVVDCLKRRGPAAARQVGRDRLERLAGPGAAVAVKERASVPAQAMLVDDVCTTGATLAACATALRAAGTDEVRAVVYARTLGR